MYSGIWRRVVRKMFHTFQRNVLPPSSGMRSKERSKLNWPVVACLSYSRPWRWRPYVPSKSRWTSTRLHGVEFQEVALSVCLLSHRATAECALWGGGVAGSVSTLHSDIGLWKGRGCVMIIAAVIWQRTCSCFKKRVAFLRNRKIWPCKRMT
jgi:hypothetical protein